MHAAILLTLAAQSLAVATLQKPFTAPQDVNYLVSRVNYTSTLPAHELAATPPPEGMVLHPLSISGNSAKRVNLAFFADGYTADEEDKFVADAERLTAVIVGDGPMAHVKHLLNVWGVFVPSNASGVGLDKPLDGAAFGLFRPGNELRGVYVGNPKVGRAACDYWRSQAGKGEEGGCDQPILLGNDGLYGGLGGEFTVITASKLNGPIVLRHELGHSLIQEGDEYEGSDFYYGANADKAKNLQHLSWSKFLTDPDNVRIEDAKNALHVYSWYDLDQGPYTADFTSHNAGKGKDYTSALLRISLSSIPYPSHVNVTLNGHEIDLTSAFAGGEWVGSLDRRWLEVFLAEGLPKGEGSITVQLTDEGSKAKAGQGGKMVTSIEIIEYGGHGRHHDDKGFVGAFPTYDSKGAMTLRPTNEECLMRKVNHPSFCPVCKDALKHKLKAKLAKLE